MSDADHRLFVFANTAALVLFNDHGNPPSLALSQKVLAEHGANLLKAYREVAVIPAIDEAIARACWQPIETAPKDGTDFLAHLGHGYTTRARYLNGKFFAADSMGVQRAGEDPTATHWMPLPEPPK